MPARRLFGEMSRKLIWGRSHKNTMSDRAKAIAHYHRHIEDVKAAVPPERLLIYSADQGWGPLCAFLGVAKPETPYPNVNDRASIQKYMNGMMRRAYGLLAATAVVAALLIYGIVRAFG